MPVISLDKVFSVTGLKCQEHKLISDIQLLSIVNPRMSKNIQTIFGVTIPIGSGKRVSFNNYNTA